MSELRRRRASETHRKYPYWWDAREQKWRPATSHPLWDPSRALMRALDALVHYGASPLPDAWTDPDVGNYNLVRFLLEYLPPKPDEKHWIRMREDDSNQLRLHWCYRLQRHQVEPADPSTPRHANEWRVDTCCWATAPEPVPWQVETYARPEHPEQHVWNPGANVGDPSYLPEPTRFEPEPEPLTSEAELRPPFWDIFGRFHESDYDDPLLGGRG